MTLTYKEIFQMENFEFLRWLKRTFPIELPNEIVTVEDMKVASEQMMKLTAQYSYITELFAYSKVYCRGLKRLIDKDEPETKEFYEDMVDRRDAIEYKMKAIQQAYSGISRAVTIKIENNKELKMLGSNVVV